MSNYKERYKAMKKAMQWTNQDVADIMGSKLNSVEVSTSKPDKDFPRWGKLAIEVYEQMIERGRITYDEAEEYKVKTDKK